MRLITYAIVVWLSLLFLHRSLMLAFSLHVSSSSGFLRSLSRQSLILSATFLFLCLSSFIFHYDHVSSRSRVALYYFANKQVSVSLSSRKSFFSFSPLSLHQLFSQYSQIDHILCKTDDISHWQLKQISSYADKHNHSLVSSILCRNIYRPDKYTRKTTINGRIRA